MEALGYSDRHILITWGLVGLMGVYILKNAYLAYVAWAQAHFVFGLHASLSQKLFAHYLRQPYVFHLRHNSAQLIRNIVVECNLFANAMQASVMLATELFVLAGVSALLLYYEPLVTLMVMGGLGSAATLFYIFIRKSLVDWGKQRQQHDGRRIKIIQEGLGSVKEIRLLGREDDFLNQFKSSSSKYARMVERQHFLQHAPRLWLEVLAVTGLVMVVALNTEARSLAESLPTIALFGAAAFRLMPSVNRCLTSIQTARFAGPAIDTIQTALANGDDKIDCVHSTQLFPRFSGQIELVGLGFKYQASERSLFKDINLIIPKGSTIGLIGGSGAGKSTLVDIILGLLTPSSGSVLVDGVNIQNGLREWQNQIGYVPQTIYLTDDTLRRNVAFGLGDGDIDDAAVWSALKAAQLLELVHQLPEGLETELGERGVRLSGGQRQRIGVARALYHNPSVLVLDEATSALDVDTETDVMDAVYGLQGEKTILIITHRVSTIKNCDRLFRLSAGRIVETNNYDTSVDANIKSATGVE